MERVWRIRLHLHNYFRIFVRKHLQHGKIDVVVGGAECPTQNRVWKRNHDGTNELTSGRDFACGSSDPHILQLVPTSDGSEASAQKNKRESFVLIHSTQKRSCFPAKENTGEYDHDTTTIQNSQHTTRHSHWDDLVSSRNSRPSPHNAA